MTTARTLVTIWFALMALLVITAGSSCLELGWGNIAINLTVAVMKAMLIMFFFMQLKSSCTITRLTVAAALLWLGILYGLTTVDYI
jgi:cytochrome c oxidase subunit 4